MTEKKSLMSYRWSNGVMLLFAVWLFISPWVMHLPTGSAASWNFWIVGVITAALALVAESEVAQWEDWIGLLLGVWLFISPGVLHFAMAAGATNAYVLGILLFLDGIWGIASAREVMKPAINRS
jgi:hypothetical protein